MLNWTKIEVAREHCNDLVREAAQEHMARRARAGRDQHRGTRCRLLCWLGRELVAWGLRLQTRQGASVPHGLKPAGQLR